MTQPKGATGDTGLSSGQSRGPATDQKNNPVVDPTDNVMKLVEASNQRQDDLRNAENRRIEEGMKHIEFVANLRAEYAEKLSSAEAKRIDAIRAVDVNAVAVASQRAADQATVLANQVLQSADTLRAALTATATTIAAQMESKFSGIIERVALLEKANYEGQGRSKVADPQIDSLLAEVRRIATAQTATGGERRGGQQAWGYVVGAIGIIIAIVGLLLKGI